MFAGVLWSMMMFPLAAQGEAESPPPDSPESPGSPDATPIATEEARNGADIVSEAASRAVDMLGETLTRTTFFGWSMLFGGILGGLILGKIAQSVLRGIATRLDEKGWTARAAAFRSGAGPSGLALLAAGLAFGLPWVHTAPEITAFSLRVLAFLYILAGGWLCYNLVDLVEVALQRVSAESSKGLYAILAPLIRKALRIFVVVIFVLFVAENVFGADITAWLAGLGIAGLAVSLSAQDSIKNLFGSVTILLDKPFSVGDRIIFSGTDGSVEEIGFRSTRVRTLGGHLITIPNMKFTDGVVENASRRPFIRRVMNITIACDTPPEKVERAVAIVKELLNDAEFAAPFRMDERPPQVHFNEFNADNLNIMAVYWYVLDAGRGHTGADYLDHAQRLNLRLMRAFDRDGIHFAFPTRTLHLAGDPARELTVKVVREGNPGER